MADTTPQSFANHARVDPPFHFVLAPLALAALILSIIRLVQRPNLGGWLGVLLALTLLLALFRIRIYALKVQDRVIRLEERLRLQALAPVEWQGQIHRLSEDQLIGLRFAGDDEVVALAKQTIAENLSRKQIKERIRNWRPDTWRV